MRRACCGMVEKGGWTKGAFFNAPGASASICTEFLANWCDKILVCLWNGIPAYQRPALAVRCCCVIPGRKTRDELGRRDIPYRPIACNSHCRGRCQSGKVRNRQVPSGAFQNDVPPELQLPHAHARHRQRPVASSEPPPSSPCLYLLYLTLVAFPLLSNVYFG